jgi:fatty-acyl-CoA synthase
MARRDPDGYIHLVDRKSNMIISGGENVYPSEVEALLATHDKVKEVAVIGLPDKTWGERVHAVIVPRDGTMPTEAEIVDWCQSRIAGYKRPRTVAFIRDEEMPRTATGKIQHRLLRGQQERRLNEVLKHDPEKCVAVFGKDHAPPTSGGSGGRQ